MAHHPNHVPLTADTPGNAFGGEAYPHNVAISAAQDASFEGAWHPHSSERIDLGSDAGFWQPSIDATHPGLHNHQHNPYFHQNNSTQSAYSSENAFNDYNGASFNPAASLLSPEQQHQQQQPQQQQQQPFRNHGAQTQFNDSQMNTIAPNVLQAVQSPVQHTNNPLPVQRPISTPHSVMPKHQYAPLVPLPPGVTNGSRFVLTPLDELSKIVQVRSLAAFTDIGLEPVAEIARSTIPAYNARRSRNEIKALLASNSKLSASINKKKKLGALVQSKKPVQLDASGQLATRPVSQSASESSSEQESEYESSEDEEEPSPLPLRRPETSSGATEYDTIKALWRPRNRILSVVEIREGLKAFWEVVQTIRERWNSDRTAVKQAEEKKKDNELPMLKERVAKQREMLEIALGTAVKHGHPDIVKHFGENLAMMGALAVFLLDRSKESDYSGTFVRAILELLIRCTTLTDGNLEKSNIGKMLSRFVKRGDADVKSLAKKISDNAMTATKKKKEAAKASTGGASSVAETKQPDTSDAKPTPTVAGVKRERSGDGTDAQPVKKLAGPTPSSKVAAKDASPVKAGASANGQSAASTSVTVSKPKTNTVTPKASGFFSLQSASKRPGTSIAAQQAAAAAGKSSGSTTPAINTPAATATPAAATGGDSRSFSVFSFIEESKKPEAKPKAKTEEKRAPETEEQRTKRERKEKRRHLRVHWKPESALVDVRIFSHDPEEELGHDASQVRDVGDIGSEGAMFKMQHRHETEMIDEEEDEEAEAEAAKLFSRDYPALLGVDFDELREKEPDQYGMLFAPYGGGNKEPESAESKVQQQRETDVLAVYYNKTDLPPPESPQEPVEETVQPDGHPKTFGGPPAEVLSRLSAIERREQRREQPHFQQQQQPLQAQQQPQFDLAAILGSIGAQQPPQPPAVSLPAQPQGGLSALDQALSQMRNKQAAPSIPAQPAQFDLAAVLASLGGQQPQSQPAPAPTPSQHAAPPAPPQHAAPPPPPPAGPDLAAILQGLSSAPQMPQVPGMPSLKDFMAQGGFSLGAMNQQQQQQHPHQHQQNGAASGYPYENEERKRWREQQDSMNGLDGNNDDSYSNKRQKWNNNSSSNNSKPFDRGGRPPPQFVVECRYFQEGKCKKGKDCTYLHNGIPASQQPT